MPCPTLLDFARIADSAYLAAGALTPGWTRAYVQQLDSGFKGALFLSRVGKTVTMVVALAGTDSEKTDWKDKFADVGFAGSGKVGFSVPIPGHKVNVSVQNPIMALAQAQLMKQLKGAMDLIRESVILSGKTGAEIFATGHSLGGGLLQMAAARIAQGPALRGVTFNAPAVSQAMTAHYNEPDLVNVRVEGDPINQTEVLGRRLGRRTVKLNTGRSGLDAHRLKDTIAALAGGPNAGLGQSLLF